MTLQTQAPIFVNDPDFSLIYCQESNYRCPGGLVPARRRKEKKEERRRNKETGIAYKLLSWLLPF